MTVRRVQGLIDGKTCHSIRRPHTYPSDSVESLQRSSHPYFDCNSSDAAVGWSHSSSSSFVSDHTMPSTEQTPLLGQQSPSTGVHHATPSRFVTYQAVSLLSAVDGILGTFAYRQWATKTVTAATFGATLDYTDAFISGLLLQGGGALAGAVCGIVFLIMMVHPSHAETKGTVLAKEITFCIVLLALLAALIYATVSFSGRGR